MAQHISLRSFSISGLMKYVHLTRQVPIHQLIFVGPAELPFARSVDLSAFPSNVQVVQMASWSIFEFLVPCIFFGYAQWRKGSCIISTLSQKPLAVQFWLDSILVAPYYFEGFLGHPPNQTPQWGIDRRLTLLTSPFLMLQLKLTRCLRLHLY